MPSVNKNTLNALLQKKDVDEVTKRIAQLRLNYSEATTLITHFLNKVIGLERIYPRILPTQLSGRWSTVDPPLTNFPKACINPDCPKERHRKTHQCWSMRDLI